MGKKYKLPDKPMYIEKHPDGNYDLVYVFKEGKTSKTIRKKLGRYFYFREKEILSAKAKEIEERLENYKKTTKEEIRKLLESIKQDKPLL